MSMIAEGLSNKAEKNIKIYLVVLFIYIEMNVHFTINKTRIKIQ